MSQLGQTRSFGDVGSMSGLPESGHGWAIHEYTPWERKGRPRPHQGHMATLVEAMAAFRESWRPKTWSYWRKLVTA
jgi:hypothetical protein